MSDISTGSAPLDGAEAETKAHSESPRDAERDRVVDEEVRVLTRVQRTLDTRRQEHHSRAPGVDYDAELIALRDQINEARLEDVPPLIEEMERLQAVAARRAKVAGGNVDPRSPYFGRLVLEENQKKREVLIGRSTFIDPRTGIRIVDWRDAPVSRIYYRYEEGDDYEEVFGGREVEGDVLTRRSLAIAGRELRRIGSPQGVFVRSADGTWHRADDSAARLHGGQGKAPRAESHRRLGIGSDDSRSEDKHLPEIAALIDAQQFDLITKPSSGLVVIQGGAGSGKTTIGLHRLAYLAFQDRKRFRADRMLVIVFNDALARYISRVLPALGVPGVLVTTYDRWAHRLRVQHLSDLPRNYSDSTPIAAVKLKKSPALLTLIDEYVAELSARSDAKLSAAFDADRSLEPARRLWVSTKGRPPAHRLDILRRFLTDRKREAASISLASRHHLERIVTELRGPARDVVSAWADLLTDPARIRNGFARLAPGYLDEGELREALAWCSRRCPLVLAARDERDNPREHHDHDTGIDGQDEHEVAHLDREDDTLLLRLVQRMRGALGRRKEQLRYEHVFVDEAQDLSPVEMAVVLDTVSGKKSVTLAGDVAQRLHMYNGFSDWRQVLRDLGLAHVSVEPLKLSHRSTKEIIEFAEDVLGPLRNEQPGIATRSGAPVELFRFAASGDAVGFLGEALREVMQSEPRASVAVIARYPEQADLYFHGLRTAEVPNLRRIASQDFPFKPGVDVTDVRQVKGLEFDYVVLLEVSAATYPVVD
ncbi:MAG: UvrD-helicase domain-containing protein [Myxococcota bacterium]